MFRKMRRSRQELSPQECAAILERGSSGVLALCGDDGYPYAVPISYVYCGGRIYFHCARSGHKLDAIARSDKASFCVIDCDDVLPEKYTTRYRSVIVFGRVRVIEDAAAKRAAIERLARKYAPEDSAEGRSRAIERDWDEMCMLEMSVEHMTGKQGKELVNSGK